MAQLLLKICITGDRAKNIMYKKFKQIKFTDRAILRGIAVLLCIGCGAIREAIPTGIAQAQSPAANSNPLEITLPDPLLPKKPQNQPLSAEEQLQLKAALDDLNAQANEQFKVGNVDAAFNIWYRELRLRRSLGFLEEVQALGRVGEIAWKENRKPDVQLITRRLRAIEQLAEKKPPVNEELLQALGDAYLAVRSSAPGIEIYEQILATAKQRQDINKQTETLKAIGQLYLQSFDYSKAAESYEQLLSLSLAQKDYLNQLVYLQNLAYIYNQVKQPENAVKVKEKLAAGYLENKELEQLIAIKMSLAADYEALGKPNDASENYQEAYRLAWEQQQFAAASEALQKLGALYRAYDYLDYALQVYKVSLDVDQQSYNYYGLMNTYDKIGQIYLDQKNYSEALIAFEKGLELAQSLKYQESYFVTQIDRVNKQNSQ